MALGDPKIYQDIEATADYYGPAVYANLLTFYSRLDRSMDALSNEFIPLTAAHTRNPQASKLFAVGVIPPAVNVTGRILDRSATIARDEDVPVITGQREADSRDDRSSEGKYDEDAPWGSYVPSLSDDFWIKFVGMCRRVGANPVDWAAIIYNESGFNPAEKNYGVNPAEIKRRKEANQPIAVGMSQFVWSCGRGSGMTREEWEEYGNLGPEDQLAWMERYMKRVRMKGDRNAMYGKHFGGLRNPDGSAYASIAYQEKYVQAQIDAGKYPPGTTRKDVYTRSDFQQRAYDQNSSLDKNGEGRLTHAMLTTMIANLPPQLVRAKIAEAEAALGNDVPDAPVETVGEGRGGDWVPNGSDASKTSRKEKDKTDGTPLNQTDLGKKYQAAQRQQIAAMQAALEQMKNTPPLRLLVNPQKFSVKGAKIVSDGNWGRQGPIIEFWGDDQDSVSASGRIAAFYAMDITNAVGPGLTRKAAKFSESWRNFMSLFLLYQSNAAMWLDDSLTAEEGVNNLTLLGSIYIYYDSTLYVGSFDSFNITETDTAPFTAEYSFEFKVRSAYLLDRPDSEYGLAYSGAQSSQTQGAIPTIPGDPSVNDGDLFSLAGVAGVDPQDQVDGTVTDADILRQFDPSRNDDILTNISDPNAEEGT